MEGTDKPYIVWIECNRNGYYFPVFCSDILGIIKCISIEDTVNYYITQRVKLELEGK